MPTNWLFFSHASQVGTRRCLAKSHKRGGLFYPKESPTVRVSIVTVETISRLQKVFFSDFRREQFCDASRGKARADSSVGWCAGASQLNVLQRDGVVRSLVTARANWLCGLLGTPYNSPYASSSPINPGASCESARSSARSHWGCGRVGVFFRLAELLFEKLAFRRSERVEEVGQVAALLGAVRVELGLATAGDGLAFAAAAARCEHTGRVRRGRLGTSRSRAGRRAWGQISRAIFRRWPPVRTKRGRPTRQSTPSSCEEGRASAATKATAADGTASRSPPRPRPRPPRSV